MTLHIALTFRSGERLSVGTLHDHGRDTVFQYDPSFLNRGLCLAPFKLPLREKPFVYDYAGRMETFGMFEDSLPDGWGRRLIDQRFRQDYGRLPTVLERLACVGQNGMGALVYEPAVDEGGEETAFDFAALAA